MSRVGASFPAYKCSRISQKVRSAKARFFSTEWISIPSHFSILLCWASKFFKHSWIKVWRFCSIRRVAFTKMISLAYSNISTNLVSSLILSEPICDTPLEVPWSFRQTIAFNNNQEDNTLVLDGSNCSRIFSMISFFSDASACLICELRTKTCYRDFK